MTSYPQTLCQEPAADNPATPTPDDLHLNNKVLIYTIKNTLVGIDIMIREVVLDLSHLSDIRTADHQHA